MNYILTLDNLIKSKVVVLNRCIMCKCSCEIVEHFPLHCPLAQELCSLHLQPF